MRRDGQRKPVWFYAAPILFSRKKRMGRKTRQGINPWTPAAAAHHQMRIGCIDFRTGYVAGF